MISKSPIQGITEDMVVIAGHFFESRKMLRSLWKEDYAEKIQAWRQILRDRSAIGDTFAVCKWCVEKLLEAGFEDDVAKVLAATVDEIEGQPDWDGKKARTACH